MTEARESLTAFCLECFEKTYETAPMREGKMCQACLCCRVFSLDEILLRASASEVGTILGGG